VGLTTYHLLVPTVMKSVSLNLLEPSGLVQACNGIDLPLLCNLGGVGSVIGTTDGLSRNVGKEYHYSLRIK